MFFFWSSLSDADPMKSNVSVTVFNLDLTFFLVTCRDYNMFEIAGTISFIAPWRAVMHEQF